MRWLRLLLCISLIVPPESTFGDCSPASSNLLQDIIPSTLRELNPDSLKGLFQVEIQKENDAVVIKLRGNHWTLKISELTEFYRLLRDAQKGRMPAIWLGENTVNPLLRAEYDYWVHKLFLRLELSQRSGRISRIGYMLSHREFFHSWISMIALPLLTWMLGHSIHFNYFDHWNKFEHTFLYVNAVSRTAGNAIRLDEVHYQDPKRSRLQLFWLVIFVSLSFQILGTGITALQGEAVYPRLDRALVVALATIFYDIPISQWVHRFQFSNGLLYGVKDVKAADLRQSQIIAEYGLQTFIRVSGAGVLQGMIHASNQAYEALWPLIQSSL